MKIVACSWGIGLYGGGWDSWTSGIDKGTWCVGWVQGDKD